MTDTRAPAGRTSKGTGVAATMALLGALALLVAACGKSDGGSGAGAKSGSDRPALVSSAPAGKVATAKAVPSKGCGTGADTSSETVAKHTLPGDRYYLLTTP